MKTAIRRWERGFRAAATKDRYAILRDHLRRLELPDSPDLLLDGTILVVQASLAYKAVDQQKPQQWGPFLEMQQYNPEDATEARYTVTFDLHEKAFARMLVEASFKSIDLADLFGNPWWNYEVAGYHRFWISHADWSALTRKELKKLENEVVDDLYFDYRKDELNIRFRASKNKSYLLVHLQELVEMGEEGNGKAGGTCP
jgi:hypothetical protein